MRHCWSLGVPLFFALATTHLTAQKGGGAGGGARGAPGAYTGPYITMPGSVLPAPHADDEQRVEFKSETVLVQVPRW
jgi:hypothetical protein